MIRFSHRASLRALCAVIFASGVVVGGVSCNQSAPVAPAGSGANASAPAKLHGLIGVSLLTLTNPFFKVIGDHITAVAAKAGYETIVASGDMDVAKQQAQVKDFIVRKASAIVLSPCDSKSIGPVIEEANAAGIPVFTCDIKCLAPGAKVVTHVATDNYQGGKLAAEAMIEALGPHGGKVIILDFKQAESCLLRVNGFKEVIAAHNDAIKSGSAKSGAPVEIVAELPGGGKKERGYSSAQDAMQGHADLAGIFAINDPCALGAVAAVEKADKSNQIKIVGFDGQIDGKQAIKQGSIYADPIQFPDQIGDKTMQTILAYFDGEKTPDEILIPTSLYRKADAERDPDLAK